MSRLSFLKSKHLTLDKTIRDMEKLYYPDEQIRSLKKEKLKLKEEISKLERELNQ
jgi:hypothetical protein